MIPRYRRPEMARLWSREHGYSLWLEVELLALEGMEIIGEVPSGCAAAVREKAGIDMDRIQVLESQVHHEVIAFLTSVAEQSGEEAGRYLHYGLTSSDMLDTALAVQITQAIDLMNVQMDSLMAALRKRAHQDKYTPCMARTHGRGAEPTTWGLKLAGYYAEFQRNRARMEQAKQEIASCKLAGAVGTYSTIDPRVEMHVAETLGLTVEPVATQAVPRDRHATVMAALAILAGSIERLATEIRLLQRQEVEEVMEPFATGQKGSSAMPHKRNPIFCENLTGLARLIRASVTPALEDIALWQERDMSHSSVERVALPDAFMLADFALARLTGIVEGMEIDASRMKDNITSMRGIFASQKLLMVLIRGGMTREDGYLLVQKLMRRVYESDRCLSDILRTEPGISEHLSEEEIGEMTDPDSYLPQVDLVFSRVFPD